MAPHKFTMKYPCPLGLPEMLTVAHGMGIVLKCAGPCIMV